MGPARVQRLPVRRLGRRALLALVLGGTAHRDRHRHGALRAAARRRARRRPAVPLRSARAQRARAAWASSASGTATRWASPATRCCRYASRLESLPAYLQQLEMESNGKRVAERRRACSTSQTCPVVWGGTETPGQHAFHQWLHQGTDIASCDFIVVAQRHGRAHARTTRSSSRTPARSREALMNGVETRDPHRACPGNRAEHDDRAAAARRLQPGRAARDLRAQGLHARPRSGASTPSTSSASSSARPSPIADAARGARRERAAASGHAAPARRDPQARRGA